MKRRDPIKVGEEGRSEGGGGRGEGGGQYVDKLSNSPALTLVFTSCRWVGRVEGMHAFMHACYIFIIQ